MPSEPKRHLPQQPDIPEQDQEALDLEQQDWDDLSGARPTLDAELDLEDEPEGDLPEEDDDNPYQDSDEALPDDRDERVMRRNPSKEGGRFDEV
jgi:hypothetical protein